MVNNENPMKFKDDEKPILSIITTLAISSID